MYNELLDWASCRPRWQRDALRRLAQYGQLTPDDYREHSLQILGEAGFDEEEVPEPVPLGREHLRNAARSNPSTVLASLGPVRNVDRLSSDQPPLRFAVNGITIVYGPNASGKSGYCRIVKQLCRFRSPAGLRNNVYDAEGNDNPEVELAFRVGGDNQPKKECVWTGDQEPPSELSRISVFDTATARIYVDRERKIEFLPYELDLMNKLGLACRDLENYFKKNLDEVNRSVNTPLPDSYHNGTTVYEAVAKLVPSTRLPELPTEGNLRELGTWTTEKQEKLNDVAERLRQDPQVMIRLRNTAKAALEVVKEGIATIDDILAADRITELRESRQAAEASRRAAEDAATKLFTDQPIPDLGSETWRKMLTYAREFAATVFPEKPSPRLARGGRCVLCQQYLSESAAARMEAFDSYIVGRVTEDSVAAERRFVEHRNRLLRSVVKSHQEVETLLANYAALSDARKEQAVAIVSFVEIASERLNAVKSALQEERYNDLDAVGALPNSPASVIEDELECLEREIISLQRADRDAGAMAELEVQYFDLVDRRRLGEEIEFVVERRNHLERRCRIDACIKQCRSTAITRRLTDRRREILTPSLRRALNEELRRLKLTHIPLNLSDHGKAAENFVEISLGTQQRVGNNSDILSEGEQRALALACFLAELREIGNDHAIIVDDPVSSLDHGRMNAVAERLAGEARGRQVIVFSHNIMFHQMLCTEARRAGVGLHCEWMSNAGDTHFGLIDESKPPWQMKKVAQRVHEIGMDFVKLKKEGYDHNDQNFRRDIVEIYTKMRETWERVIEEVLINNVVQRFRPEVMTLSLRGACIDPSTDHPKVFEGMKRCSRYSGHDPALDLPPNLPEVDQIDRDIRELRSFSDAAMDRRKELNKQPSYEEGIAAVLL